MDLKTLVTQSEIDKENFARMLLRGEGNFMKQVLENPQPLGKPKKKTGNRFFHNFFKTIGL
jgi:hypothetical protein